LLLLYSVLANRYENNLLIQHIDELRNAFRNIKNNHPFIIDAIVILPEHLHCLWQLPQSDADYSTRWRLIKSEFSKSLKKEEYVSKSRQRKKERGIWQRRFWEYLIRDDKDYLYHFNYIHYNPVKHGYVTRVRDWQYSSFHRWVAKGIYPIDWATMDDSTIYKKYSPTNSQEIN
jgi:putative transposase